MIDPTCLFCRIIVGEVPADVVHQDELILAFRDIAPKAPVHLLLIPRSHISSAADLRDEHADVVGRLFASGARLAAGEGLDHSGYRVVTNVGKDAGQSVDHLHFHLLGGRAMTWPPG